MEYGALLLALLSLNGVGNVSALKYIKKYGYNIEKIIDNIENFNINKKDFLEIIEKYKQVIEKSKEKGIGIITLFNEDYPKKLLEIKEPILYLFYRGKIDLIKDKALAIIGSRQATEKSIQNAKESGKIFGLRNIVIVSGLAIGCDINAHIGCLEVNGKNLAVLPGPLDVIYPKENENIALEILQNEGCLISEYAIESKIEKYNFVKRDRIQSAIANTILVIEAKKNSGTIYTAKEAIKQNKEVYSMDENIHNDAIVVLDLQEKTSVEQIINSIEKNYRKNDNLENDYKQIKIF